VSRPPSRSYRAGKRGRHRHRTSPETKAWERDFLPPSQPAWMAGETYRELVEFRRKLKRNA